MSVELRIALDCFDFLTINVEARTDLGVRVETFSIRSFGIGGVVWRRCPARFPVHARPCVRCAVKIGRGDPRMRGRTALWCSCLDQEKKQRDAELLTAHHTPPAVIPTTHSAMHLVAPELCLLRYIPSRFPSTIRR